MRQGNTRNSKSHAHTAEPQTPLQVQVKKSRIAAALLAFFLGGFGVHKFYLGKIGQGIPVSNFLLDIHPRDHRVY